MTNEEAKEYWLRHERVDDKEQSEAVWAAINALKKQIPKKPYKIYSIPFAVFCGSCDDKCCEDGLKVSYCWNCGQAIDWGE